MLRSVRRSDGLAGVVNSMVVDLPVPVNISYWYNFGFLLGVCLVVQIVTGVLLAMHYTADVELAFRSVGHITRDVEYGYVLRSIHGNGAAVFFICVYLHIGRSLYYGGYMERSVWNIGVVLYVLMVVTAFLGYVLPWGQMSYWAATVITNLLSAIPYVGGEIVSWVWGGFSISNATLHRIYSAHYLLPFIIGALAIVHMMYLHRGGSGNPVGVSSVVDRVGFHPYFVLKDLYGMVVMGCGLLVLVYYYPYMMGDSENYLSANALVTPAHIKPEWYFLFIYAILRSIPSKLGGVLALVASILVLFSLSYVHSSRLRGLRYRPIGKLMYWCMVGNFIVLTWIGGQPVEVPYIVIGQIGTVCYFGYYLVIVPVVGEIENRWLGLSRVVDR